MQRDFLFTSESVTEGHPDKLADQISDAIVDGFLAEDPQARVACETLVKAGFVVLAGEYRSRAAVDTNAIVRRVACDVGYTGGALGFDGNSCGILSALDWQSPDIAQGVDSKAGHEQGAGDQGMMFGYACNETHELMPAPIALAHRLARRLAEVRHKGIVDGLRPDGKVQVTMAYEDGRPKRIDTIVVSAQHHPELTEEKLAEAIRAEVIAPTLPPHHRQDRPRILINPTGRFVLGGPQSDAGLTGRKIIVDTYGGMGRHGGGAFSGKDPSKVDRSAAYFARYIAKNVVAAHLAERCEVQLAYAIGVAQPVSLMVQTFGTAACDEAIIEAAINDEFDARPAALIERLRLLRPIFRQTATYGHFGRDPDEAPWEATDAAARLAAACGVSTGHGP